MKAIVQDIYGGPDVLHFTEVAMPVLRPHDLLVRVYALSVNPVDTKVRSGGPPGSAVAQIPMILGWDAAGVVEQTGPEVTRFRLGDAVFFAGDITRAGSYAEYVAVDERIVGHKPQLLSFEAAAAMPLTALTAWEGMFEQLGIDPLAPTRPLLIVGGAGGVGSIAVQIAARVAGRHVVATASRAESADYARAMGAAATIDHRHDFAAQVAQLGLSGFDHIFSTAQLENFSQLVAVLNPLGKICLILSGPASQALDVSGLMAIRGTITWELMFTRPRLGVEPERQGQILDRVANLLDAGVLTSTQTQVLSWRDMAEAHRRVESGHTIGKIVLVVD